MTDIASVVVFADGAAVVAVVAFVFAVFFVESAVAAFV